MILKNSIFLSFLSIFIFFNGSAQVVSKENKLEQGLTFAKEGRLSEAIATFKLSVQSDGENAPVLFYIGNAYFDLLKHDSAYYYYARVLSLDASHK